MANPWSESLYMWSEGDMHNIHCTRILEQRTFDNNYYINEVEVT